MNKIVTDAELVIKKITSSVKHIDNLPITLNQQNENEGITISIVTMMYDWYRAHNLYKYVAEQGYNINIQFIENDDSLDLQLFNQSHFVILSKIISNKIFDACRYYCSVHQKILIYDLDDCFHQINSVNKSYDYYNLESNIGQTGLSLLSDNISKSDHVFYSTRELMSFYLPLNFNQSLLPNYLDLDFRYKNVEAVDWRKFAKEQNCDFDDNTLIIGFFGSESHAEDLDSLEYVLPLILTKKNVLLAVCSGRDLIIHSVLKYCQIPYNKFFFYDFDNVKEYPKYVKSFDIGIAPLINNIFNRCKTPLKLMEYGALGIPYIASKVAPYQRYHLESDGVGGFICNSNVEWIDALSKLIDDKQLRRSMGSLLQDFVYNNNDVSNGFVPLMQSLKTISDNSSNKFKKPDYYQLSDICNKIPKIRPEVLKDTICACGSGDLYLNCKNSCYPAWGEIKE
jgi:glycosyltransferase involved in cell wall biosynthesis